MEERGCVHSNSQARGAGRRFEGLRRACLRGPARALLLAACLLAGPAGAAAVDHLNTQTATATGSGVAGKPGIASFNVPSGKNRVLFVWVGFERDHCGTVDICNNTSLGVGLGDNWPEPRLGTPPNTTSNNQVTANFSGPGGTLSKRNALTIGGTPSGDLRFQSQSSQPAALPASAALFSQSTFHIALFEDEITQLLGGNPSGTISISLPTPGVNVPLGAGDDAIMIASVFQNVEQTAWGMVRNALASQIIDFAGGATFLPGNFVMSVTAYDGSPGAPAPAQTPDEADDGKLVMAISSTTQGFIVPAGHTALATPATTNAGGIYDNSNNAGLPPTQTNEPNGASAGAYFRNGGASPASLYSIQSAATAATATYGGMTQSFLLESDLADMGDAPISYGNPSHAVSGIRLGTTIDADASLLNSVNADGDDNNGIDDEDGMTIRPLPAGLSTTVAVSIQNGSGFLSAWFDWNRDGDFTDAGEQVATDQAVSPGTLNLPVTVPQAAAMGTVLSRFRVCTTSGQCATPVSSASSGEVEDHQFTISPTLVLRKTTLGGAAGPFGFTLTNVVNTTGTVTTTAANTAVQVDGDPGVAGIQPFQVVSAAFGVQITESSLPPGWSLASATCVDTNGATIGSLAGTTYSIPSLAVGATRQITCDFSNNGGARVVLQKAVPQGRTAAGDQFILSITGPGGPASVTTTGTGTTANGAATIDPATPGEQYTFNELGSNGANLGTYTTTYSCTNALSGGQTPSGSGTSFSLTAAAGDDLTCTFSNVRNPQANLSITNANNPGGVDLPSDTLAQGAQTVYTITVANAGPDAADGAVVQNPPPTGLTCTTASCGNANGGAACPAPTGAALVAALASGVAIPTLPANSSLAFELTCTVD